MDRTHPDSRQIAWVHVGNAPADPEPRTVVLASDYDALRSKYASAVRTLQDIAAERTEAAILWPNTLARDTLTQLGEPVEPEGETP
jgi:hypothetical protein